MYFTKKFTIFGSNGLNGFRNQSSDILFKLPNCICKEFSHENTLESKTNNDLIEKINLPKLKLNEYSSDHSTDVDEQIDLKCNFDCYSVHEFHKLKNNTG